MSACAERSVSFNEIAQTDRGTYISVTSARPAHQASTFFYIYGSQAGAAPMPLASLLTRHSTVSHRHATVWSKPAALTPGASLHTMIDYVVALTRTPCGVLA